jgi:hypothetical protein
VHLWEQDKREICDNNDAVRMLWHIAERVRYLHFTPGRSPQLLIGGDGNTYLGASKAADL